MTEYAKMVISCNNGDMIICPYRLVEELNGVFWCSKWRMVDIRTRAKIRNCEEEKWRQENK